MKNTWFWIKFTFLAVFALSLGVFNLPESVQKNLPLAVQEQISSYKIKLGIDLSGGTKLEYKIDFTEAEKKLNIADETNDALNTESLKKSEIANGVVKTLKKRIDPDGTKEVSVFSSQRGEEWFVVVELTADIDTEENRAKLEKITSLEFKTPYPKGEEGVNAKDAWVNVVLNSAIENNRDFDEIAKPIVLADEGRGLNLETAYLNEIVAGVNGDEDLAQKILTENPEYVGWREGYEKLSNDIYLLTYYQSPLAQTDRVSAESEKTFADAEKVFPSEKNLTIDALPSEVLNDIVLLEGEKSWTVSGKYLVEKTQYDTTTQRFLYSLIDLSSESDSVVDEYIKKEVKQKEDSRFIRFLYLTPTWKDTALGGGEFKVAKVGVDQNTNYPIVHINFTPKGGEIFGKITGELAKHTNTVCGATGDVFAIFVDNKKVSAPCVREKIAGNAQISMGSGTLREVQAEANQLADNLNSGATPAPISLLSERKISASLGEKALELSIYAALIGFVMVAIWIILFYRFSGVLAVVALVFYALFLLSLFKYFGFVLTLSGIAGIVLSIGMAVDANILIFERIKEELQSGEKFSDAVATGFDKAWSSIRDSNFSSLITCFILFALGTSIIKAFAITLAIGILVSMFTAITFTRYLIEGLTPKTFREKTEYFIGVKKEEK